MLMVTSLFESVVFNMNTILWFFYAKRIFWKCAHRKLERAIRLFKDGFFPYLKMMMKMMLMMSKLMMMMIVGDDSHRKLECAVGLFKGGVLPVFGDVV